MTRSDQRFDGWKEIAASLGRTVRTVQRWERRKGLPVHRLSEDKGKPLTPARYARLLTADRFEDGQRSAVSGQRSAVSGQRSAVSGQRSAVSGQRSAVKPAPLVVVV